MKRRWCNTWKNAKYIKGHKECDKRHVTLLLDKRQHIWENLY